MSKPLFFSYLNTVEYLILYQCLLVALRYLHLKTPEEIYRLHASYQIVSLTTEKQFRNQISCGYGRNHCSVC